MSRIEHFKKRGIDSSKQATLKNICSISNMDSFRDRNKTGLASLATRNSMTSLSRHANSSYCSINKYDGNKTGLSSRSLVLKSHTRESLKLLHEKLTHITAGSFTVARLTPRFEIIAGKKQLEKRKIASLTKIMTLYCSLRIAATLKLDLRKLMITVSAKAASIIGTTAALRENDLISLYDLLFGMMLPSGNDAAYSVAEYLGNYIMNSRRFSTINNNPVQCFVDFMNQEARLLKMFKTLYMNPHGLDTKHAYSCTEDVAKLCVASLKLPLVREIIKTKEYRVELMRDGRLVEKTWSNTNKLLAEDPNCLGFKTGITPQAGPCLSSYWEINNCEYLVVVTGCSDVAQRNKESRELGYLASELLSH